MNKAPEDFDWQTLVEPEVVAAKPDKNALEIIAVGFFGLAAFCGALTVLALVIALFITATKQTNSYVASGFLLIYGTMSGGVGLALGAVGAAFNEVGKLFAKKD